MTEDQIKYMVDRFLGWKLPEDFHPDAGISFKKYFNEHLPMPSKSDPTGTNLFDAEQATAMVRYMVDGMPAPPPATVAGLREALDNSQGLLAMVLHLGTAFGPGISANDWENETLTRLMTDQIMENRQVLATMKDELETAGRDIREIRNELDRTRSECASWKEQFDSAAAAASEYSEFWEKHHGDFDQFGNYISHSQIDGDLRAAKSEIERLNAALSSVAAPADQERIARPAAFLAWAVDMFGPVAKLRSERLLRFIEEAIELAHAENMERHTLDLVATRVYSRPRGDTPKEIGQAQATLEMFADNIDLSSDVEAEREWQRVQNIPRPEWERRHAAKAAVGIAALSQQERG